MRPKRLLFNSHTVRKAAVLQGMSIHSMSEGVQEMAAKALLALAAKNPNERQALACDNGVKYLLKAILTFEQK